MTAHKHFKQLVRARMQKTGESYAIARRHVLRAAPQRASDPGTQLHERIQTTRANRLPVPPWRKRARACDCRFSTKLFPKEGTAPL